MVGATLHHRRLWTARGCICTVTPLHGSYLTAHSNRVKRRHVYYGFPGKFSTTFLCFLNGCRCSTFVNKSTVFSAVSRYFTVTCPAPRGSRTTCVRCAASAAQMCIDDKDHTHRCCRFQSTYQVTAPPHVCSVPHLEVAFALRHQVQRYETEDGMREVCAAIPPVLWR